MLWNPLSACLDSSHFPLLWWIEILKPEESNGDVLSLPFSSLSFSLGERKWNRNCSCEGQAYVSGSGFFCCVGVRSVVLKSSIDWWFECLVPDGGTISSDSRDLASGIKPEEIGHLGTHYYWQLFDVLFGSWLAMMETALLWHLFLQPWYSAQACGIQRSCIQTPKPCARIINPSFSCVCQFW